MTAGRWLNVVFCTVLVTASGCKVDKATHETEEIDNGNGAGPASAPAPRGVTVRVGDGIVNGTVAFVGKAPAKIAIDTSMDPACAMGGTGTVYTEQYAVNAGKLANVFVYVKSGPPAAMQAGVIAVPVVMDQRGCQYVPHVIGVVQGGTVQFKNADVTMHNIHTMPTVVGNEAIDISQGPRGVPVLKQFRKPELMIPVRCNNHPWMNAFINVAPTPFFAVSDAAGHFSLTGLPAGQYTIGAVQEKLGEQDMTVTVPAHGKAKADFSFSMK
jgi:plastocyanin